MTGFDVEMYFYKWLGRTYAINRKNLTAKSELSDIFADLKEAVAAKYYSANYNFAFAA